jgi:hypothetical protein
LATYLGHHRSRRAAIFTWTTLLVALLFKVATLVAVPQSENYFGAPLQSAWTLGRVIGPDTGRIAADPSTSYYLPAATDNGVITLSGHADSGAEPARSDIGYRLMHQVYAGGAYAAGDALLHLWHAGVRWVVAEKSTSLRAADRHLFFFGPYSALIDHSDMALMARYFSRLSQAGTPVYDDAEYTVFRLDGSRLRRAVDAPRSITPVDRSAVGATLRTLVGHHGAGAVAAAAELYRRGVRVVTLSLGAFGSQPHIYALGQSLSAPDMVTVAVSARGLGCHAICYSHRGIGWMSRLGQVVHRDSRFMTVVALRAPASAQANPSEPRS